MSEVFNWFLDSVRELWDTYMSVRIFCYWLVLYVLDIFVVPAIRKLQGKE